MSIKRIVLALVIVLAAAGLVFGGIYLRMAGETALPAGESANGTGTLPEPSEGGEVGIPGSSGQGATLPDVSGLVVPNPVFAFWAAENGDVLLVQPDGKVLAVKDGKSTLLSSASVENLLHASFSFDGKKAFFETLEDAAAEANVLDVSSSVWTALPDGARSASWSPHDYRLLYFVPRGTRSDLYLYDLGARNPRPQLLLSLTAGHMTIDWGLPNIAFLTEAPSGAAEGSVWAFDVSRRTLTKIASGGGVHGVWSSAANAGVLFTSDKRAERDGALSLVDVTGRVVRAFSFLTLPSKCSFASPSTLVCGIPKNQSAFRSELLPDAYEKQAIFTIDDVYQINMSDGAINILDAGAAFDISSPRTTKNRFYFINRYDKKLYGVPLKS